MSLPPKDKRVKLGLRDEHGGYNGHDRYDAGLLFAAFTRDPDQQFVALQHRLAARDALNRFIEHTGSAIFAIPPGAPRGGWLGPATIRGIAPLTPLATNSKRLAA